MKLLALLLAIIMLIPAALVGGNLILRETTGADIISTAVYANRLREEVNEEELCPNAITKQDMLDTKTRVNQNITRLIAYHELEERFDINFDLVDVEIKNMIELSGKEVACLAEMIIMQEDLGQIKINEEMYMDVQIKSADFVAIDPYNTRINVVMTLDVTPMKDSLRATINGVSSSSSTQDPSNEEKMRSSENGAVVNEQDLKGAAESIVNMIPDILYVNSTFVLEQKDEAFSFNIHHEELRINSLTKEQTETIFTTINLFSSIGNAEYVNVQIGTALANALVGSESERGLAYSLIPLGATGFDFVSKNGVTYFTVVK